MVHIDPVISKSMSNFEKGGISWEDFLDLLRHMITPSFEGVIAEIVDNSFDKNSKTIQIELYGRDWDEFSVIIYDNGSGFESSEDLLKAFNLGGGKGGKKGDIGRFNIGLKLTPLSRCQRVSVFAFDENESMINRSLDSRVVNHERAYGTTTDIIESPAQKLAVKTLKSKLNDFSTAVVLTSWEDRPGVSVLTTKGVKSFAKNMAKYLGIIYEERLLDEKNPVSVNISYGKSTYPVVPRDPFWKDFTPAAIEERMSLPASNLRSFSTHQYEMGCFIEWGTLATTPQSIPIEWEGATHLVEVTGYSIPVRELHGRIPTKYKKNVFNTGEAGVATNLLKAPNTGGLYFYRNGRCICFGPNGDEDSNNGWYSLVGNVEPWHGITRIKINFPEELDEYFRLAPTKDRVKPRPKFFEKLLMPLSEFIDEPRLRGRFREGPIRFFAKNPDREDDGLGVSVYVQTGRQKERNSKKNPCKNCEGDPSPWHHKDTLCPKAPCETCGEDCEHDNCEYECPHPSCGDVGDHHVRDCPLNCQYCEYPEGAGGHGEETCPNLCGDCKQPKGHCECPCENCEKPKRGCMCCKSCSQPKPCDCDDTPPEESELIPIPGGVLLKLFKDNENNEKLIQEALKDHLS